MVVAGAFAAVVVLGHGDGDDESEDDEAADERGVLRLGERQQHDGEEEHDHADDVNRIFRLRVAETHFLLFTIRAREK